jgi:hypothetical protein
VIETHERAGDFKEWQAVRDLSLWDTITETKSSVPRHAQTQHYRQRFDFIPAFELLAIDK